MSSELAKIISFSILNGSSKTYLFKENGTLFLNTKITFLSGNSIIPQSFMLEKVIRFSTMENLSTLEDKIFSIDKLTFETVNCTPSTKGVRTVAIKKNFKKIYGIILTPYFGSTAATDQYSIQYVTGSYAVIIATKQLSVFASSTQTIEATIIGTI